MGLREFVISIVHSKFEEFLTFLFWWWSNLLLEQVRGARGIGVRGVDVWAAGVVSGGSGVDGRVVGRGGDEGAGAPAGGARVVDAARERAGDLAGGGIVVVSGPVVDTADGECAGHKGGEGEGDKDLESRTKKVRA